MRHFSSRSAGTFYLPNTRWIPVCSWLTVTCLLLYSAGTSSLRAQSPPASEYSGMESAFRTLDTFLDEATIAIGDSPAQRCSPFPDNSRMLAYEENQDFIFAAAELPTRPAAFDAEQDTSLRRILVIKPSIFVIQDVIEVAQPGPVRWTVQARVPGELGEAGLCFKQGDKTLLCNSVADGGLQFSRQGDATYQLTSSGGRRIHCIHVLSLSEQTDTKKTAHTVDHQDQAAMVTVSVDDRTFQLTLPRSPRDSGSVAIKDGHGQVLTQPRPLAAGVLPHGPDGVQLMERWDRAYRDGRTPPWDTGIAAADLRQAVEQGELKPCRTVVLGCGSGTNAIYLASKGFDVTAIDVSPTALGIAQKKAEKAGVNVRWTLADVLAPPDLQSFDLVFDRGCYHNVRYVDAAGFTTSLKRLTHPGSQCLILSLNRQGPPGITEQTMRDDFRDGFQIRQLKESNIQTGSAGNAKRNSWILQLERTEQ